ncbi:MAG: magnesium chelatase, partial [Odoribacter sp.]|nr:magnesium chelatase [Odoribacter sp.]
MTPSLLKPYCPLDAQCVSLLKMPREKFGLSARAYDRIIKVSRTIADLDTSPSISPQHIAEAIQYRSLDRDSWGR